MLFGFDTENEKAASGALLIYAVYKSRDTRKGPSGLDMWGQIERFARRAAKRATNVSEFLNSFKRQMACSSINPRYCKTEKETFHAIRLSDGSIVASEDKSTRDFMVSITEMPEEEQSEIIDCIYSQTQRIIFLVRDRLEREKVLQLTEENYEIQD